jgi:feruloyl esterase
VKRLSLGIALAVLRISSTLATECEELKELELPHTEITLATVVEKAKLPSYCRVAGTSRPTPDSDIRFEVWMPTTGWNGKFVGVGNGAWAGSITDAAMVDPLLHGYATAATDDGHQGSPLDASFAAGHPDKLIDFAYRAPHEMTVAAKAIINAYYVKPPTRSLFASCSTGGRQGLMEAARYPEDYDAIAATAPANPMVAVMVSSLWTGSAPLQNAASRIPKAKFELIHQAAVAACDAKDGLKDQLISAPDRCNFDPASLQCKAGYAADCLTPQQVAAMRAIYRGAHNPRTGQAIIPGFEPGSEALLPLQVSGDAPFPAAVSYFRDLLFRDPRWDFQHFDYDRDVSRAVRAHSALVDIAATGLDEYFREGHKLLLSHGWADPLIPPMTTVRFYRDLKAHAGASSAQLFMIPGMGHCGGGDGPFVFDALKVIDEWAETGRAPERIVVSDPGNAPKRTRPLCPFPQEAVYNGSGSVDDEKSFRCGDSRR